MTFPNRLFIFLIIVTSPAWSVYQGLRLSLCQTPMLSLRQQTKLELVQGLDLRNEVKLTLRLFLQLRTPVADVIEHFSEYQQNGALKSKSLKLYNKGPEFEYFVYDGSWAEPNLQSILDLSGGAFVIPPAPIVVVDQRRFPQEFLEAVAVHEYAEYVFGSHERATAVEFFYAKKKGFLKKYVNWLEETHPMKVTNVGELTSEIMNEIIQDEEFPENARNKVRDNPVFRQKWDRAQMASDIARDYLLIDIDNDNQWKLLWPDALVALHKRLEERTQTLVHAIAAFQRETMPTVENIGLTTPYSAFRAKMEGDLKTLLQTVRDIRGPVNRERIVAYWNTVTEAISVTFYKRLQDLRQIAPDPQLYSVWSVEYAAHPLSFMNGDLFQMATIRTPDRLIH